MPLSWNEIKDRALRFSKEWADTYNEEADAKPFLDAFFEVFGVPRKKIGTFEHRVKKLNDGDGYIDLLWKGTILVEMKSKGKNLDNAFIQAKEYTHNLKIHELPKYILVSDFHIFRLFDTEEKTTYEFKLPDLVKHVNLFGFISGYQKKLYKEQDPANIKAAELLGKLHDRLEEIGYVGHPLEVYLVRILFCLFSEDTTIFNKQQFQDFLEQRTNIDGSDLAAKLQELFQVLNTPTEKRFKNIDEQLNDFPFVNGKLFEESLPMASFDSKMRQAMLECCYIDWSKISPAIFGSMFQSVMNPKERRNIGAHYTSETNILKLIKPLFLDELWKEFESIRENKNKLPEFHKKISNLKFLDPACGCGNFLVITYRELRLLELEILRSLYKTGQGVLDIREIIWLDVDMMSGIEFEEFPARIAEVAMWLIDHQMNMQISNEFGQYFARLPLKKSANIVNANALQIDWNNLESVFQYNLKAEVTNVFEVREEREKYDVLNIYSKNVNINPTHQTQAQFVGKSKYHFILGNPPFIGKGMQNPQQKIDMERTFAGVKGAGVLDYVSAWYLKAAQLIQNTQTKVAFVSTNSISQGEQVGVLWNVLFNQYKIKIHFAHRTFSWRNEAKGNAAVHVVIIGFANYDTINKSIFEYDHLKGEAHEVKVRNINPYLVEGKDFAILSRSKPICEVPELVFGNMANDGGNLILQNDQELDNYILYEPQGKKFIRYFVGSEELINGYNRHCFWLKEALPEELKNCPILLNRIEKVRQFRKLSTRDATKKLAAFPMLFGEIRQKEGSVLVIPRVSSENRFYVPMAFFDYNTIINDRCTFMKDSNMFHFGVLTSSMHMTWMKYICGRLKSDYNYSNNIVYNNFPWPESLTENQSNKINIAAQQILEVRGEFSNSSLSDLYNPLTMPSSLVKAHIELDKAVDLSYRTQPFTSDANRMVFLFELYEKYTADLFTKQKVKKKK